MGSIIFEGYSKAKGIKVMKPKNLAELVIAISLDMPGVMDNGQRDLYLERRRSPDARRSVKYIHAIWEKVLSPTYGAVIFQEQPMAILRALGMETVDINIMLKVVKDSGHGAVERNRERLAKLEPIFVSLAQKNGITDTQTAWASITGFMGYGFNMGHAAGYAIRAYRMAYLKVHYPLEFHTALLAVASNKGGDVAKKKIPLYTKEARRFGIAILPPHVNTSDISWKIDRNKNAMVRGLNTIPGVGNTASEIVSQAPYVSITDMCTRLKGRALSGGAAYLKNGSLSGRLLALGLGGALDGLPP